MMDVKQVGGRTTKYFRWCLYENDWVTVIRRQDDIMIARLTPGSVWEIIEEGFSILTDDEIIELLQVTSGWLKTEKDG